MIINTCREADAQIERRTGHSVNNLAPMAQLARYPRREGFRELVCLPEGELSMMVCVKSVLRPSGDYWVIWEDIIPARLRKRGAIPRRFVTSTALRPAMPLAEWEARRLRTRSIV